MELRKDPHGKVKDERGRPVIHRPLEEQQWRELKSHLGQFADRLTDDVRHQFDGLLTIWLHPWEFQATDLTPSEAKSLLEGFADAIAVAASRFESLRRTGAVSDAMVPDMASWNSVQQCLATIPELSARAIQRIKRGTPGPDSDDAHAFIEQIDDILYGAGLPLANSDKKGTDFVGFVVRLLDIGQIAYPDRANKKSDRPEEETKRAYATTLIRAQVRRRNLMDSDYEAFKREG